ncbi:Ig-like domain-containing protein [Aeromonas lacus]
MLRVIFVFLISIFLIACNGSDVGLLDGDGGKPEPNIVISLQIIPKNPVDGGMEQVLPKGSTIQYQALATYQNGDVVDVTDIANWTSSNPEIAGVDLGLVTGLNLGSMSLVARYAELDSNIVPIRVTDAFVARLQITPVEARIAVGTIQEYKAIAFYTDGTAQDVSENVNWVSINTAVATISVQDGEAIAMGNSEGVTTVRATIGNIESNSASLTVTNAQILALHINPAGETFVPKGLHQTFTAIGEFSDKSTQDMTSLVNWRSDNPNVASIVGIGDVKAMVQGSAHISASYRGALNSNEATITVTDATLTRVQVDPAQATIAKGTTQDYTVTGIYSDDSVIDLSDQAGWVSSDVNIATVVPAIEAGQHAVAQGNNVGSVLLTAIMDGIESQPVSLSVTSAMLTKLVIDPVNSAIPRGTTQSYQAIATFSDESTQNVSRRIVWATDNISGAPISPDGVAYGHEEGNYLLTASYLGMNSNSAALEVTSAQLQSLDVVPVNASIAKGLTQRYRAVGSFTDGTFDLTSLVHWNSNTSAVSITGRSSFVVAHGLEVTAEPAVITATFIDPVSGNPVSGIGQLTVTDVAMRSLRIDNDVSDTVPAGGAQTYAVTALLSDGSEKNVSDFRGLHWVSDSADVFTRNANPADNIVQAIGVHQTSSPAILTASLRTPEGSTITDSTSLSIGDAVVVPGSALLIKPELTPGLPVGLTQPYRAYAFYTDGQSREVTLVSDWISSDNSIASVDNNLNKGLVTANAIGSTNISASYVDHADPSNEIHTGSAFVRVTDAVITKLEIMQRCELAAIYPEFERSGIVCDTNKQLTLSTKRQLMAIATLSNGDMRDVTALVEWSSNSEYAIFEPATKVSTDIEKWLMPPGVLSYQIRIDPQAELDVTVSAKLDGLQASYILTLLRDTPDLVECSTSKISVGNKDFLCPPTANSATGVDISSNGESAPGGMFIEEVMTLTAANSLCIQMSPLATVTPLHDDLNILFDAIKGDANSFNYGDKSLYYQFGWPAPLAHYFIMQEPAPVANRQYAADFRRLEFSFVEFNGISRYGVSCMIQKQ